jgi:uncharacterized protein YodC (DUF2158 family)
MKIGDLARLKSGGPVMTITFIGTTQIECSWFVDELIQKENFPRGALITPFTLEKINS